MKGRTGLPANALCRIAFCLSLKEPGIPNLNLDSEGQEFNRFLLTGKYDELYIALLKTRLLREGFDPEKEVYKHFKEHIERGIILLYNKVKAFKDLGNL